MEEQRSVVISRTEKPNSYEFGKAGNRYKLYFDKPEELKEMIDNLIKLGLYGVEDEH